MPESFQLRLANEEMLYLLRLMQITEFPGIDLVQFENLEYHEIEPHLEYYNSAQLENTQVPAFQQVGQLSQTEYFGMPANGAIPVVSGYALPYPSNK